MTTLIIHTPDKKSECGSRSFEGVFETGIGKGYALSNSEVSRLDRGDVVGVVVLRKDKRKRRAEGRLVQIELSGNKTPQGLKRYDIHMKDLHLVDYKPESLNHFGVGFSDES